MTGESRPSGWFWAVLLAGVWYAVAGILFGALAGQASSSQMRVAWRLAAWVVSAVAFAAQIAYEAIRRRELPRATALHAALAAALGAFGLAGAAKWHALTAVGNHRFPGSALVVW